MCNYVIPNMKNIIILVILIMVLSGLSAQHPWELEKNEQEIKVWTRKIESSSIKEFKLEATINENIETVISGLIDLGQLPQWYSYISKVSIDTIIENKRARYCIIFDLPWPVRDRYAEIEAQINLTRDKALIDIKAFQGSREHIEGYVRVLVLRAGYVLEKTGDKTTKIIHTGHMEPAGLIPAWLANSGVSDGPFDSISKLKTRLPLYRGKELPIKY